VFRAIETTGRKKLIFAGISLEICAAFPAMTAVGRGLDAYVAVDACGTFSQTKRYRSGDRKALVDGDSKAAESTQPARGTLNRYLLILKRLIFESSVRAGSPSFVAAPDGPEIRP
jgi:hypothetical protein